MFRIRASVDHCCGPWSSTSCIRRWSSSSLHRWYPLLSEVVSSWLMRSGDAGTGEAKEPP
eukprot:scaffold53280_cov48-Phaeocystis_antarctica.AAC.2